MKIRLKMQVIRNSAALFLIQVGEQKFQAAINPIALDREDRLRPGENYAVTDASAEYNYVVTIDRDAYDLISSQSGVYSIVIREMKEIYEQFVCKKIRTAKREKIGYVLDSETWKFHPLRTVKVLSSAVAF